MLHHHAQPAFVSNFKCRVDTLSVQLFYTWKGMFLKTRLALFSFHSSFPATLCDARWWMIGGVSSWPLTLRSAPCPSPTWWASPASAWKETHGITRNCVRTYSTLRNCEYLDFISNPYMYIFLLMLFYFPCKCKIGQFCAFWWQCYYVLYCSKRRFLS